MSLIEWIPMIALLLTLIALILLALGSKCLALALIRHLDWHIKQSEKDQKTLTEKEPPDHCSR